MSVIHKLDEGVINQIAAGEVVERPFSVVKELVENSIDADARRIFVITKNGGKDFISVFDDGKGMSAEDVEKSVQRHATSKIKSTEDIAAIRSMGFRGEALAAISSVSRLTIQSCMDENSGGTILKSEGGEITLLDKAGFVTGTKITVENLFYNTPARRKFLRQESTEIRHIADWLQKIALCYPSISFRLTHNQKTIFDYPSTTDSNRRIGDCIGHDKMDSMLPIVIHQSYLDLKGMISIPDGNAKNNNDQYLFINNRYVRAPFINQAVYDGYRTLLMKGAHPRYVLQISIDPSEIDVNVHPAKTEIRFRNKVLVRTIIEETISSFLRETTRKNLLGRERVVFQSKGSESIGVHKDDLPESPPEVSANIESENEQKQVSSSVNSSVNDNRADEQNSRPNDIESLTDYAQETLPVDFGRKNLNVDEGLFGTVRKSRKLPNNEKSTSEESFSLPSEIDVVLVTGQSELADLYQADGELIQSENSQEAEFSDESVDFYTDPAMSNYEIIGQFDKFIIASLGDDLAFFDKHATHERIRFEEIRQAFYSKKLSTESLLIPQVFEFTPRDSILLDENLNIFHDMGFEIENFGRYSYRINKVPAIFSGKNYDFHSIIKEVLDDVAKFGSTGKRDLLMNGIFERMACHSSIRGNRRLSMEEMESLLKKLSTTNINLYCPHGRPVMIRMDIREMEKKFKRIV